MNFLLELRGRIRPALEKRTSDVESFLAMVRPVQEARFGDYQANFAMALARPLKQNPRDLATEIAAEIKVDDLFHPPEVAGAGFINFKLKDEVLADLTAKISGDERVGIASVSSPRTIVIDFSGPNIAKPMHVGHLRSTVLGDALCRLFRFLGHRVIGDNHLGDWGTQFGMIIYGYKHFLDPAAFERDPVTELARLYRLVNQLCDYRVLLTEIPRLEEVAIAKEAELTAAQNSASTLPAGPAEKEAAKGLKRQRQELAALRDELAGAKQKRDAVESDESLRQLAAEHTGIVENSRRETARLHAGDEENLGLWKQFLPACLTALQKVYDRLNTHFDVVLGESFYQPMLASVVEEFLQRGIAQESDGAICIFVPGFDAPFIIRKGDGAFTYGTTDLATIRYRVDTLHADEVLYVVDARQSEHFKMLFAAAEMHGGFKAKFRHISFGSVLGPDRRPYKTRSGDTVGLESLLDEAVAEARKIVDAVDSEKKESSELDEATRGRIAEIVGLGGIKYADLRHNRESDYIFSWEKMLAKNGDTATYIQYSVARIHGVFRRGNIDRNELRNRSVPPSIELPEERKLLVLLLRLEEILAAAAEECRPNMITQHLFEIANAFSVVYDHPQWSVLRETDEQRRANRLLICDLTARTLTLGLSLLGIEVSEQM